MQAGLSLYTGVKLRTNCSRQYWA